MKQGKRWIALMLALAMCLSVLPANVLATELGSEAEAAEVAAPEDTSEAAEVEEPQATETGEPVEDVSPSTMAATSGKCGKNLTWKLDSKGTLTISGSGKMKNYEGEEEVPWRSKRNNIKSIIIKNGVTTIGSNAFCACAKLTKVEIPNSVKKIEDLAFGDCGSLKNIKLPDKITSISGAFTGCSSIKAIRIPDGITRIGEGTFFGCSALKSVEMSSKVTSIDEMAFYGCSNLKSIRIPEKVTSIGWEAFYDCNNLKRIYFTGSAPTFDNYGGGVFQGVTATAYYPQGDKTWTNDKLQNYGGNITWKTWRPNGTGKVVSLSYSSGSKKATNGLATHKYYFDDAFFYKSNETYHNALAVMSLGLELTAFSHPKYDSQYTEQLGNNERAENLKNAYEKLGFSNARYYNYNTPLSDCSDKVAFSFATKEITNETNTDTLVAVVLRGGGYGAEWGSNFYVGDAGNSTGFYFAARRVLQDLRSYLATADVKGELKLWITGYSRAAATANILAHYINGDVQRDGVLDGSGKAVLFKNVYAYTFATPNGYRTANADNVCDNNIMNIVSDNDLVVRVPLEQWGFYKYGRTYILNTKLNRYVEKRFGDLTGQELTCYNAKYELESFLDLIHEAIPSTKEYVDDVQTTLVSALAEMYSTNTSKKQNSENSIQAVAKALLKGNGNTVKTLYKVLVDFVALLAVDRQSKEAHLDIGVAHWPEHYLAWLESGGCKTGSEKEYVRCGEQEKALIEASVKENCTYRSAPGVINNPGISTKIVAKDIVKEYSAKNQIFSLGAKASSNGLLHYASDNDSVQVNRYGSVVVKGKFIGKATITITVDETDIYKKATKTITVTVKKASQPIKVSPAKKSYKASALKKKAKKFNIKVKKAKGKVTYTSNSKSVTVNGKGKVTVSKGIKKGTYKVTVTAAETSTYAKATQTVVIRIT